MERTEHYQLCLWEKDDPVLRADFNKNNEKLETALLGLEEKIGAGGTTARIVTGEYKGNGKYGSTYPNKLDFADTMGRAPSLICISAPDIARSLLLINGMTRAYSAVFDDIYNCYITWTETGLSWYHASSDTYQLNSSNKIYSYVALF